MNNKSDLLKEFWDILDGDSINMDHIEGILTELIEACEVEGYHKGFTQAMQQVSEEKTNHHEK